MCAVLPTRLLSAYLSLHHAQPALRDIPKSGAGPGRGRASIVALTVLADCGNKRAKKRVSLWLAWAPGLQGLCPRKVTTFQSPTAQTQPNTLHWTHRAVRTAQEKVREGLPHEPASDTGAELEKQRLLPASGSSARGPCAPGTDPAAIPGNSRPLRLKRDRSQMAVCELRRPKIKVQAQLDKRFEGGRALVLHRHSWLQSEPGDRATGRAGVEGMTQTPVSGSGLWGRKERGTLRRRP